MNDRDWMVEEILEDLKRGRQGQTSAEKTQQAPESPAQPVKQARAAHGVEAAKETPRPVTKHKTELTAAKSTTPRKDLKSRMAVRAGKITRDEISMAPIIRIPRTMVRAVRMARRVLYRSTRRPVARAKLSSKVTAKSLW